MPLNRKNIRSAALAALIALLAVAVLAACGSSSKNPTATASASSSPSTAQTPSGAGNRFLALRECLKQNGVNLPARKAGGLRGFQLPNGVSRSQYEAALKKCGGGFRGLGGTRAREALRNSPAFRAALEKFAACMRESGVKLPPVNTTGSGPLFNITGINTSSAKFKAGLARCRPQLAAVLPNRPGAAGTPPRFG